MNGTHQCECFNFCGDYSPTKASKIMKKRRSRSLPPDMVEADGRRDTSVNSSGGSFSDHSENISADGPKTSPRSHPYLSLTLIHRMGALRLARCHARCMLETDPSMLGIGSPTKNKCDKHTSSWRYIGCHTDQNRYYT